MSSPMSFLKRRLTMQCQKVESQRLQLLSESVPGPWARLGAFSVTHLMGQASVLVPLGLLDFSTEPLALDDAAIERLFRDIIAACTQLRIQSPSLEAADELNVWFVGPVGSDQDPGWIALRQEVLRDAFICPKCGWLPARETGKWEGQLAELFAGSFLARPWQDITHFDVAPDSILRTGGRRERWSSEEIDGFQAILGQGREQTDDEVVAALLAWAQEVLAR